MSDVKDKVIATLLEKNPDLRYAIKINDIKDYLTKEQSEILFKKASATDKSIYFIVSAFMDVGLRASEIIKLKQGNVNISSSTITLDGRIIEFGREFASAVRPLLETTKNSEDFVLKSVRGRNFSNSVFVTKVNRFLNNVASIDVSGTNTLRRTYFINHIQDGQTIEQIARLSGYDTVKYLLDYIFDYTILGQRSRLFKRLNNNHEDIEEE